MSKKKIIHLDMDAFYASIEKRDNPKLQSIPVVVGGMPNSRGVVSTCCYEARKFGIHSSMPAAKAKRLCNHAIFIHPKMNIYKKESRKIFSIYSRFTNIMEPLSLDEAYLDVTEDKLKIGSAIRTAKIIKKEVYKETGLTVSAGVSYNKFLAKTASDMNKPDGLTVLLPDDAEKLLKTFPVEKFYGIGNATSKKMHTHGIYTGGDIIKVGKNRLYQLFGKQGLLFYDFATGVDTRPVMPDRVRKSIGREVTLPKDLLDKNTIFNIIKNLASNVSDILKKMGLSAKTVILKIRYFNFHTITRSHTALSPFMEASDIFNITTNLVSKTEIGKEKIRLVGISVSGLENHISVPKQLFFSFEI